MAGIFVGQIGIFPELPMATRGKTKDIDATAIDETGFCSEGSSADGVVFWPGPKSENDEIGIVAMLPEWVADVRGGRPENGRDGRFRISDFGFRNVALLRSKPCFARAELRRVAR